MRVFTLPFTTVHGNPFYLDFVLYDFSTYTPKHEFNIFLLRFAHIFALSASSQTTENNRKYRNDSSKNQSFGLVLETTLKL
jgi:hypothetical protein